MNGHSQVADDPVLSHLVRHVRPASVKARLAEVDPQRYTAAHEVILLAATFNVNGRTPPSADLSQWLRVQPEPDIVAVGFQEIVPLSASNVVMGASLEAAAKWDELISGALYNPQADSEYRQVAAKQMVGLYLSVWVRGDLAPCIRGVQATSVGTGVMGYLGNKGAVAVRLRVHDTGVSLVNCHLSSGQNEGDSQKRHCDYGDILRRGVYPHDGQSADLDVSLAGSTSGQAVGGTNAAGQWGEERSIISADHVFWMGDLNYRLNMPDGLARKLMQEDELEALADGDELIQARRAGFVFPGWAEGPLNFPPTYKFRRGTDQYVGAVDGPEPSALSALSAESFDSAAAGAVAVASRLTEAAAAAVPAAPLNSPEKPEKSEKQRTPAWTDRVLWRSRRGPQSTTGPAVRQIAYSSVSGMTFSDHRPVHALFCIQARELVRERVEAEVEAARREVNAQEMAEIPRARLEPLDIDLGEISDNTEHDMILANTGQVPAVWRWIPLPTTDELEGRDGTPTRSPFPPWASVDPPAGALMPGAAQRLTVSISAQRAKESASASPLQEPGAAGKALQLDTIMILQITGGSDIFCSLTGRC